jgi:hypothetical protein
MLFLSQAWRLGGLHRASPVPFRASYFTSALHPADATAQRLISYLYRRWDFPSIPSTRLVAHFIHCLFMQDGTGGSFPVGLNSLRLNLPCYFSVKPGVLAACISPHRYLLGPAISPLLCIQQALRPKDSSPTCIGDGIFHPFHQHASWRTYIFYSFLDSPFGGSSK